MITEIRDGITLLDSMNLLEKILADRTTGKNILWATDTYETRGERYKKDSRITPELILGENAEVIRTRAGREAAEQNARTRSHAEGFSPLWIVRKMNDHADEMWFGYPNVFFRDGKPTEENVRFWDNRRTWQDYVDSRRLEITCGEAPFLVTRYDAETGEEIPLRERVGILDRKLRVVNENAEDEAEWLTWATRAVMATYGYELQGDSLFIARLNVLLTFRDHLNARFGREPTEEEYAALVDVVVWNLWQMDGLTDRIPFAADEEPDTGGLLFGMMQEQENTDCRLHDWRTGLDVLFFKLKEDLYKVGEKSMKFDFIIGNPPYQDETTGDNKTFAPPIYHRFIDESYQIGEKVELIHPARFLFNAGQTPKQWNEKMLNDTHLKILYYQENSESVFHNTDIKGGVVVSYYDPNKQFGAIRTFTKFAELNSIIAKVAPQNFDDSLTSIIFNQNRFNLESLFADHPECRSVIGSDGRDKRFRNNIFEKIGVFTKEPTDIDDVAVLGVIGNKREWRYIQSSYFDLNHENINKWKVLIGAAIGRGEFGESFGIPVILEPGQGYTQTYIGVGAFDNKIDAENLVKYIQTKLLRAMLGVLKTTQHNESGTWRMIPLQDFTPASDIDWTKSIPEIDRQLYAKYGLDDAEIEFIETHVKEMT